MMQDNLLTLYTKFMLVFDKKYAGGSIYKCLRCGQNAHSEEGWFPCRKDFVPMKVLCNECGQRWKLEIVSLDQNIDGYENAD